MSVTSRISLLMLLAGWLSTGQAAIREIEQATANFYDANHQMV